MEKGPGEQTRRVAVLAVHGVADQGAGESARSVAGLMLAADPRWNVAREDVLHVAVERIPLAADGDAPPAAWTASPRVRGRSARFARALATREALPDAATSFVDGFFDGEAPDRGPLTYQTPLIHLQDGAARDVDVLECHWADLSRAPGSLTGLLMALYQLLLHLPSLGRHALDGMAVGVSSVPLAARICRATHDVALDWILRYVAMLNLILLIPCAFALTSAVPASPRSVLLVAGCAVGGAFLLSLRSARWPWPPFVVAAGAGVGALLGYTVAMSSEGSAATFAILTAGLTACGCLAAAGIYDRFRPGAFAVAQRCALASILLLVACVAITSLLLPPYGIDSGVVAIIGAQVIGLVNATLRALWLGILILGTTACIAGVCTRFSDAPGRESWMAAALTARFSLGIAVAALFGMTLPFWAGLTKYAGRLLPDVSIEPWKLSLDLFSLGAVYFTPKRALDGSLPVPDFVELLANSTAAGAYWVALAGVVIFAVAVLLALWPSIVDEVRPPLVSQLKASPTDQTARTTLGIDLIFGAANMTALAVPVALGFAVLAALGLEPDGDILLGIVTPSVAAIAYFAKSGLRTVQSFVDVVLDVDNYMREHPRRNSPRVLIYERLHAVIQAIVAPGPASAPYDALVIVAHSQGTVIVADYLRWLHRSKKAPRIHLPPVHLITMGSPLAQLYSRCFPGLYGWVGTNGNGPGALHPQLRSWTNLYREADYIGRELNVAGTSEIEDVLIGPGAHTHYWDKTAKAVGTLVTERARTV